MTTRLVLIFLAEGVTFLLASINFRATAKYRVSAALATDAGIAALGFTLTKWVAEATSPWEQLVYVAGATVGSWIGMRMTRHWGN